MRLVFAAESHYLLLCFCDNDIRCVIQDGDCALLDLALEAHSKREILRLTETFMTMPLQQLSQSIRKPIAETELILLR